MNDGFARLDFCVAALSVVRALANALEEDFRKRLLARLTFVYVDNFLKVVGRVKNAARREGADVRELEARIRQLTDDHEKYFAKVRDLLIAHRDSNDLGFGLQLWNDVDLAVVSIFTEDAARVLAMLEAMGAGTCRGPVAEVSSGEAERVVRALNLPPYPSQLGMADLAPARGDATMISTHPLRVRGGNVLGCLDALEFDLTLARAFANTGCLFAKRLAKVATILDFTSFLDCLVGFGPHEPEASFFALARKHGFAGLRLLETLRTHMTREPRYERRLREVYDIRNRCCAHLDSATPLTSILYRLDSFNATPAAHSTDDAGRVFFMACRADDDLWPLTMHRVKSAIPTSSSATSRRARASQGSTRSSRRASRAGSTRSTTWPTSSDASRITPRRRSTSCCRARGPRRTDRGARARSRRRPPDGYSRMALSSSVGPYANTRRPPRRSRFTRALSPRVLIALVATRSVGANESVVPLCL